MRNPVIFLLSVFLCFYSCDDGDIITVDLDFDDLDVKTCGDLVFYKEKSSPAETISIQLGTTTLENLLNLPEDVFMVERTFAINGSNNRFNYRTYSEIPDDPFCSDIPSSELNIISDDESDSGTVSLTITLVQDDNDGIPAELEDVNGNGDLEDDDTDGDGLPNYIDVDDDGDNVLTSAENPNYTEADLLATAQDSDLDGIPDYLDNDDDNDGTLTRDEENFSQDNNPLNDISNVEVGADFLNPDVSTTVIANSYRSHTIGEEYEIIITILGLNLSNFVQDEFFFGTYESTDSQSLVPDFN